MDRELSAARTPTRRPRDRHQAMFELSGQLLAEVAGLRQALESRAVIEQAKGILVATTGCDPDRAFELLALQSQHENRKLRAIAADLVSVNVRSTADREPDDLRS